MSARGPIGVSSRKDLFTPRGQQPVTTPATAVPQAQADREERQPLDLVVLQRVLGYNRIPNGLLPHPSNDDVFVKSMGALVSLESLTDPTGFQRILRAHDMSVTAIDVSPSGTAVASSQEGSQHVKGFGAPVFIWQIPSGRRVGVLKGLHQRANVVAFSPDEKLVLGCGEDCMCLVWDVSTGEAICGHRFAAPISVGRWVQATVENRDPVYRLSIGAAGVLYLGALVFQRARMQWSLEFVQFASSPSAGLIRSFRSLAVSLESDSVFIGTSGGEVAAYKISTRTYRSCVGVCSNGVNAIVALDRDLLLCGGGDGRLFIVRGTEAAMRVALEITLDGGVVSIGILSNQQEALVGTTSGRYYRCLLANLSCCEIGASPLDNVVSACLASRGPADTCFVTASEGGEVRLWDLVDYACLGAVRIPKAGRIHAVCSTEYDGRGVVIASFDDGSVRCFERCALTRQLWIIPEAHKQGTTCLAVFSGNGSHFMVSGGGDGVVRVWLLRNRELIIQWSEHRKSIVAVCVDEIDPSVIHTAALDGAVISFNLKSGSRIISHTAVPGSSVTSMTQRRDSEREIIVTDTRGRLVQFDIDVRDAVSVMQQSSGCVRCSAVSPSGIFLATGGEDGLLVTLLQTGEIVFSGVGHSAPICCLLWTLDERQILTGGLDGCVCVWGVNSRPN